MTQQYGFRSTRNLAEVLDRDQCLDNLGIDRRDLSILVGTSAAGVAAGDYQSCLGLTSNLETQITALSAIPGPLITTLNGKIRKTGDSGITSITGTTLNSDRAYYDTSFNIYSASTQSYFSPVSGSDYTNGAQYRLGTVSFPSALTTSSLNYQGSTLLWSQYFVRYRAYYQFKDAGDTVRYAPLYLAPPSALTSNLVWLDSEYSTFNLSGTSVLEWRDVVGRTIAFQNTSANRPTYVASDINDKPAIRFDGSNDSLSLGNLSGVIPSGATLIAVFSLSNSVGSGNSDYGIVTSLANSNAAWSGTNWGLFTSGLVANFPGTSIAPVNGTHIVSVRASSAYGLEYRLDGSRAAYTTSFTYSGGTEFVLGGRRLLKGDIHAVAIYNTVLSDAELRGQEEYFRWRYGFVVPDPDAADLSYTKVLHDEDGTPYLLEDDSILEVG